MLSARVKQQCVHLMKTVNVCGVNKYKTEHIYSNVCVVHMKYVPLVIPNMFLMDFYSFSSFAR